MYKISALSLAVFSALAASQTYAEPFCKDGQQVEYGGAHHYLNETFNSNRCVEIGAYDSDQPTGYKGIGENLILESGSRVSVLGELINSTAKNGSYLVVSKDARIAVGDYNVGSPALADNLTVENGALVYVNTGGTIQNSTILGQVNVYYADENETGRSIDNTVGNGGALFIYLKGEAQGTHVLNGGTEHIQSGAISKNTIVESGGAQKVYLSGISENAIIHSGGIQNIYGSGAAKNALIEAGAIQYVYDSATANNTEVYGTQYVYWGNTSAGAVYDTNIHGNGYQQVQNEAVTNNTTLYDNAEQVVWKNGVTNNTTLNNNSASFIFETGQALGNTILNDTAELYLVAGPGNTGAFAQSVAMNGTANKLVVRPKTDDTDSVTVNHLSGNSNVIFEHKTAASPYAQLRVENLSGSHTFHFNTSINDGRGDYLTITNGSGSHKVAVKDSGAEITHPTDKSLDLITDIGKSTYFTLASAIDNTNINAVDGGIYMYYLNEREENGEKIWYLSTEPNATTQPPTITNPNNPDPSTKPQVTPSVDVVLSVAAAPTMLFNQELGNLRWRKGDLPFMSEGGRTYNGGAWGRVIADRSKYHAGDAKFKLEQAGFEVGADKLFDAGTGKVLLGAFASYNDVDVKHDRGGKSSINSTGVGIQIGYFAQNGIYVDGILKYNRFENKMRGLSTNKSLFVSEDYTQNAFGGSVEVGYNKSFANNVFIEPYAKLTYAQVEGKTVNLSNKMRADIDDQSTLNSELAFTVGKTFQTNSATLKPYVVASWSHEFTNDNKVTINNAKTFEANSDFSGDWGRLGLGIDAKVTKAVQLYGELNYRKGNKVESPIQANIGIRYQF
ncbi:autotransporter outer membrane beta-barrel domain-containing protein [Neisseria sp. Ec49-e6-T10]|uniref:autotransporter outer membrane beta-barrel domain-containing protein n=1 Tax=Neisseria sp. Ec49-e6-T10 TaxID=3140744 RepID=UPI003EBD201C